MKPPRPDSPASLRSIALFEAAKGTLVVLGGLGLLALLHDRSVAQLAESLVHYLHLAPRGHLHGVFIQVAEGFSGPRELQVAAVAGLYAVVRFVEAWGLWMGKRWAEWFAAGSGALYIPFEIRELAHRPSVLAAAVLAVNVVIVAVLVFALRRKRTAAT